MSRRDAIMDKIVRRLRVDPQTGCHLWTGPTSGTRGRGRNYPRMSLDGQTVAVHIVVYCHYYGYLPSKRQVDHTCRNRLCCNPAHLEGVTHLQNQKRRRKASCIVAKSTRSTKPVVRHAALQSIPMAVSIAGECGKKLTSGSLKPSPGTVCT